MSNQRTANYTGSSTLSADLEDAVLKATTACGKKTAKDIQITAISITFLFKMPNFGQHFAQIRGGSGTTYEC